MALCMCIEAKKNSPNCRDFESRLIPILCSLLIFLVIFLPAQAMQYLIDQFAEAIRTAAGRNAALHIRGGGTKDFYGNALIKRAGQDNAKPGSYDDSEVEFLDVASY